MLLVGLGIVILFTHVSGIGCPIKWLTGISCAGCGMTRAIFYALQLQFGKAFYYHPLFWMMPFLVLLYLFWGKLAARVQKFIAWSNRLLCGRIFSAAVQPRSGRGGG